MRADLFSDEKQKRFDNFVRGIRRGGELARGAGRRRAQRCDLLRSCLGRFCRLVRFFFFARIGRRILTEKLENVFTKGYIVSVY